MTAEPALTARLSFHGTPSGVFCLTVAARSARTIAANFLGAGDDAAVPADQVEDVTRELANMICGAMLSRIESGATFDISPPELTGADAQCGRAYRRSLALEDGTLDLSVSFEQAE
jgi:CheY-specific phosphatase CheX